MTGYLTVTEAAGRLHMHPATVRRWIQRGWITARKLPNGRYLVPESEVEKVGWQGYRDTVNAAGSALPAGQEGIEQGGG